MNSSSSLFGFGRLAVFFQLNLCPHFSIRMGGEFLIGFLQGFWALPPEKQRNEGWWEKTNPLRRNAKKCLCLDSCIMPSLCVYKLACVSLFIFRQASLLSQQNQRMCQRKELISMYVFLFTIINGLLVNDASFSKTIQVIQLHLLPRYVSDAQVHIPKLLVLLLYPLVQSPCDLDQTHRRRSRNSLFPKSFLESSKDPCAWKAKLSLRSMENYIRRSHKENESTINQIIKCDVYLDNFGANLKGAGAELLAGAVRILSVDHTDVGTASGRDHLQTHRHTLHYFI